MPAAILQTDGLGLDIGGATIVADVDLEVGAGEFLGVIGPNGAGKTSLLNLLSGLVRPTSGSIRLDGRDVTRATPSARARAGLGRTFQLASVFPRLSAFENARLATEAALGGTMRIWRRAASVRPAVELAEQSLERVGLAERGRVPAGTLAGGEKRKLELAMMLAARRPVLLLDEPLAGVTAADIPGLVEAIGTVHRAGTTVLMVEHHIEAVLGLAERIAVMHHGRLLACDTPANVMANRTVQQAYVGEPL